MVLSFCRHKYEGGVPASGLHRPQQINCVTPDSRGATVKSVGYVSDSQREAPLSLAMRPDTMCALEDEDRRAPLIAR